MKKFLLVITLLFSCIKSNTLIAEVTNILKPIVPSNATVTEQKVVRSSITLKSKPINILLLKNTIPTITANNNIEKTEIVKNVDVTIPQILRIGVILDDLIEYGIADFICKSSLKQFQQLGMKYCSFTSFNNVEEGLIEIFDNKIDLIIGNDQNIFSTINNKMHDNIFQSQLQKLKSVIGLYNKGVTLIVNKKHSKVKNASDLLTRPVKIGVRTKDGNAQEIINKIDNFYYNQNNSDNIKMISFSNDYDILSAWNSGKLDGFIANTTHPDQLITKLLKCRGSRQLSFDEEISEIVYTGNTCKSYQVTGKIYNEKALFFQNASNKQNNFYEPLNYIANTTELLANASLSNYFVESLAKRILEDSQEMYARFAGLLQIDENSMLKCGTVEKHEGIKSYIIERDLLANLLDSNTVKNHYDKFADYILEGNLLQLSKIASSSSSELIPVEITEFIAAEILTLESMKTEANLK